MKQPAVSTLTASLLLAIRAGIGLLLLTPFVVTDNTVFPFVVGKALYSRALVEVVFALWAVLASVNPAFRPPRSWLLILLAAGLAWGAVAAGFGVSPQRSWWSNYERMGALVGAVHWLAFVVVAASVLRSRRELRALLCLNLVVGVGVALLAVAGYFRIDPILYGVIWERHHPRIGTVFGNSAYLGIYASVNFAIACGLLARSLAPVRAVPTTHVALRWALRLLLTLVAALQLWAVSLSGSLAAAAGLACAAAFVAVVAGLTKRARPIHKRSTLAVAAAGVLAAAVAGLVTLQAAREQGANPLLQRMSWVEGTRSFSAREPAWRAGIAAVADRPWLGWGRENFIVAFGRHAAAPPAEGHVYDRAHNELFERAVAEGLPGVAAYLGLWAFALWIVVRAAKRQADEPRERACTLFVGAALTSYFIASQMHFGTAALELQLALLLAYVVGSERAARRGRACARPAASFRRLRQAVAAGLSLGAAALAVVGLAANQAIYAAAQAYLDTPPGRADYVERAIEAFPPLAAEPRRRLFDHVANEWEGMRGRDESRAMQLLAVADGQVRAAIAAEPENWRLRWAVARMYAAVAATEPAYGAQAARHAAKATDLAPNL